MDSRILSKCETMCPIEEIVFRIEKKLVHQLEMNKKTKMPDQNLMVKEYRRSAAATDHMNPSVLRTPNTLLRTIDYLLKLFKNATPKENQSFSLTYSFVTDRLRAIRQDMILQQCSSSDTQQILERMLPCYIVTEYKCIVTNCKEYNWKLHSTQLEECFSRWAEVYKLPTADHSTTDLRDDIILSYFLRQLDSPRILDTTLNWKRQRIISKTLCEQIYFIAIAYRSGNFYKFFQLISPLNEIPKASVSLQVAQIRVKALSIYSIAYKAPNAKIPISFLCKNLLLDSEMLASFLNHFQISIIDDFVYPATICIPMSDLNESTRCKTFIALQNFDPSL